MASKNSNLSPDAPEMQMQQLKESRKQFKQEQKNQRKEARKKAKELENQERELDEQIDGNGASVVIVTLFIILIWLGILILLVKMDVGGFGSNVLTPIFKDVPVINKILPSESTTETSKDKEAYGGYSSLKEAVEQIKTLEKQLDQAQSTNATYAEQIDTLKAEVQRLKTFEDNQVEFQKIKELKDKGYQLKAIRMLIHNGNIEEFTPVDHPADHPLEPPEPVSSGQAVKVPAASAAGAQPVLKQSVQQMDAEDRMTQFRELMADIVGHAISLNNEEQCGDQPGSPGTYLKGNGLSCKSAGRCGGREIPQAGCRNPWKCAEEAFLFPEKRQKIRRIPERRQQKKTVALATVFLFGELTLSDCSCWANSSACSTINARSCIDFVLGITS